MSNVMKLAARNLLRYRRRTLLTSTLIVLGVVAVLTFVGVSGSFKNMMVGAITDSMLGHLQVHRKGYVAALDSLPVALREAFLLKHDAGYTYEEIAEISEASPSAVKLRRPSPPKFPTIASPKWRPTRVRPSSIP